MRLDPAEEQARHFDSQDELASFRSHFYHPKERIYLDGNSLGLLSRQAEQSVLRVMEEWKSLAIEGWTEGNHPWFFLAETLAHSTAPLLGAEPNAVIVANSTTVNLHQLLATLYRPAGRRTRILADALSFPSDIYAMQSQLRLHGLDPEDRLVRVASRDGLTLAEEDLIAAMTDEVQIAVLPAVLYQSGQLLDMALLTREAHARGILIGFDCAHSIGSVPHQLDAWGVDFAFWCNYKYLNNGPGGTGGLYLNRRHFGCAPGLAGWFSSRKETQFELAHTLDAAEDAGALQIGTPNILSMAPLQGSLELFALAGQERLRRKSLALTHYLMERAEAELGAFGVRIGTPREDARRGGHVALLHPEATRICKALKAEGVVPDYRPPHIVRLAPVALYNSFLDCHRALLCLRKILECKLYQNYPTGRGLVA